MDTNLEFKLSLNEVMSGAVKKLGGATHTVFTGINKDIDQVQQGLTGLGKPVKLSVDSSGIGKAGREVDRLDNQISGLSKRSIAMGAFMGSMLQTGVMAAGRQVYDIGRAGLMSGIEMEKNIVGLSTFVGEGNARKIVGRVATEGVMTPYTTQQLLPIERGLDAMGLNIDRAHRDTWALANAVAATGGSNFALERMGWHMQQSAGLGYADGRILREFNIAGIPIAKVLQDAIPSLKGLSQEKAMSKLDNMTISYDLLSGSLYKASQSGGMFAGAMEKLSQTIGGKWSTVMDKMQIAGWKITESQAANIKKLEDNMIGFADKLPGMMAAMAGDINTVFGRIDELAPSVSAFIGALGADLSPLKGLALSHELTDLSTGILGVATNLTEILKPAIVNTADLLKASAGSVGDALHSLVNWVNFVKSGKMPEDKAGASGVINYANKESWFRSMVGWLLPSGGMIGRNITQAQEAGYKYDYLGVGKDKFMGAQNQFWAKTHNYREEYKNGTGVGEARFGMYAKKTVAKPKEPEADQSGSNAIIGGGGKQVIMNFHAPLYKVDKQIFERVTDVAKSVENLREEILMILKGIPGYA